VLVLQALGQQVERPVVQVSLPQPLKVALVQDLPVVQEVGLLLDWVVLPEQE
jgi:hypothetical protein